MTCAPHPFPADRFAGRGIVICAGGARMFTCAWVAINVLRRVVGCELPIELWHLGPGEIGSVESALLGELGVETVDALALPDVAPPRIRGGWELKSFAIVHSRFAQVISLDADNVPVRDPASLLDTHEFAQTGAIAWPDVHRLRRDNPIWSLCGLEPRDEPSWESGQLVFDKTRCWHALQVALHMNMHSDVFYRDLHGDKDTFHLGFVLAGADWAMPSHPARWTRLCLCQRDFDGDLLFQHRSGAKWRLDGPHELSDDFIHEQACVRFLAELRARWSGHVGALPDRTGADLAAERTIADVRWYELGGRGVEPLLVELLPGNRVGIGVDAVSRQRWCVVGGALVLAGRWGTSTPLHPGAGGEWSSSGSSALRLTPSPEAGQDVIGLAAQAIVEQVTRGTVEHDDAVIALAALARAGDLTGGLARAQGRWRSVPAAVRVVEAARRRIGITDASLPMHFLDDRYEPIE